MSLKGFHIVFVTVSTLLCVFLALWGFFFASESNTLNHSIGSIGIVGAVVLLTYGVYFYRKVTSIRI